MAKNSFGNIGDEISSAIEKVNAKNPYLIVGIVCGAILIMFYFGFFQSKLGEITILNGDIGNLKQSLDETKNNLQRLNQYNEEVTLYRKRVEVLSKKIRNKDDIPVALENLSRLAVQSGVRIEQMMPDEARGEVVHKTADTSYIAIPIVIGARSSYHSFGKFVNSLEKEGIFLGFSDLGILTNPADNNQHMVKLVLRLAVTEKIEKSDKASPADKFGKPGRRIN
ncbi:MAG: type 4a pilus biogenesis protein PilO [Candidatus Omnitrophica bacterium]|nr:type 4a pilus biogenesis protein PilO [Candidatus Omnitrophota bacterium]